MLLLGGVFGSPHIATGQSTVTFDDQGFSDQEIVSSPLSISAGGKAIVFEDVNTTISDFQYRTSEGGTLNYDQRGELVIRTQSGEEIDASTIELTLSSSGQSTSDATITGYRDGYQVAQLTGVSFGNSSDPQEKSLSGFTAVDRIVIKVNSYNGPPIGLGTFVEFDDFTFQIRNNPPAFENSGPFSISENPLNGAAVGDVDANNGNGGATDANVTYSITSGNSSPDGDGTPAFAIDSGSGAITVNDTVDFDFETRNSFRLTVEASDGGGTDTKGYTVNVTDMNEAPTVATNEGLTLDEGKTQTIGTGALSASDEDAGDGALSLTYTVTTGPANGTLLVGGTSATSFTQQDIVDGTVAYRHDGSETTSGDFTFALTDDEGAGPAGQTFAVTVGALNDAPTISALSDETIQEDATLGPVSVTVGDAETAASSLTVTAASDDQALVPDANITLGGSDASRTIEVAPAANESGTATITVTVDDGSGSNNTASESFVLTVTAVPDLAITDGSAAGLDFSGSVQPGTDNNPVGNAELSVTQAEAAVSGITIANSNPGAGGITAARLFVSTDASFDPGADAQLGSDVAVDPSGAPATLTFSGPAESLPAGATAYVFLAVDVEAGAPAQDVRFSVADPSALQIDAEIVSVNGVATSTFTDLPLTNSATTLPVKFAGFDATADGRESVTLRWQTASETGNAGFRVQRRGEEGTGGRRGWVEVGSVDGAGTTNEPQSYTFVDTGVPYDADSLMYRLKQVDVDGSVSYSAAQAVVRSGVDQTRLLGTYPNPARSRATVRFAIPDGSAQEVTLRLYDVLGRQVRTVRTGAEAGRHELTLDTNRLPNGTYFLRLTAGGTVRTQQVTVVR